MRRILTIARHDLHLVLQDRSALMWLFLLPVVFATFFGLVMGGGGPDPSAARARLTVINEDSGFLSRALVDDLGSENLDLVEILPGAADAAADKIRTLTIPTGFTDSVLRGEQVALRLERDADTSMEASLVAETRIVAAISSLISRLIEASEPGAEELDAAIFASLGAAEELVRVEAHFAGEAPVIPSGFAQSIPGNAVMFVLLVALTYGAASIAAERNGGLLRRLVTAPLLRNEIVMGKIAGRLVVALVQITVLVAVGVFANRVFGVYIGNDVLGLYVVLVVFALTVAPLGVMFGAWFRDPDRAANIGVLCTMVMAALGGCWWPREVVPEQLQRLAYLFPTGWAMDALHQIVSFGRGLEDVTGTLAVLVAFAVAFTVVAARSLRVE